MFSLLLAGSTFVGAVYAASNVSTSLAGTTVTTDYGTFTYSEASACACSQLSTSYPEYLYFPNTSNYTYYNLEAWDIRTNADPACIFSPINADQVAAGVGIISTCDAQFAVRGGGHMNFPGANNINAGVMVALAGLNDLQISADNTTVDVGPGNRWYDVYSYLEPYGRIVIGGRLKTIGVPGLTLIGGVHYFNNKYGYAMDNVVNYDVVLGNGTQVKASADCNPDLFWALKGGANNFGIVTKFTLNTFDIPLVSTTIQVFDESGIEAFLHATCDLAANNYPSIAAGAVVTTTYNATTGAMSASLIGVQAGTESPPSRFKNFTAITALQSINNVSSMASFAKQLDSPLQMFRVEFAVHFMKPNGTVLYQMWQMWKAAVEDVKDVVGFYPTFVTNLDPKSANTIAKTNGIGNVWGRDDTESGIWWQMSTGWDLAQDDLHMTTWIQKVIGEIHNFAIANNVSSDETDFIYMGDGGGWQNPFSTMPAENVEKMITIREKYDPLGAFSRLNWGGFKLPSSSG
ncbi:hypothetical protein BGAL_0234g00010 [Botrytis galanthina]|uniref:FAD-binding PCMH-type domain-containing protein n=1 Tax=Botrytis galanthina TaxID=278940 RepID=A0A4S8QW21_9HELO|nr:hypothetical protein BGAL_0234g00010 [Botrytis galanthina]